MTSQIFPNEHYNTLEIAIPEEVKLTLNGFTISPVKSIWEILKFMGNLPVFYISVLSS